MCHSIERPSDGALLCLPLSLSRCPAAQVAPYFASLGHPCPQYYNPAEFLADLISIDTATPEAEAESRRAAAADVTAVTSV